MGKNKNKKATKVVTPVAAPAATPAPKAETKKEEVKKETVKAPVAQTKETPKITPKVETKKPKETVEKPKEGKDPAVVSVTAEEVKKDKPKTTTKIAKDLIKNFSDNMGMDANHMATFVNAMVNRVGQKRANGENTQEVIEMERILDYNMGWMAIRLSAQLSKEKKTLGINCTNDDLVIQQAIDMFQTMGVKAIPIETEDGQQQLQFADISKETKKEAEEENKQASERGVGKHHNWTEDELDPVNWKTKEFAQQALKHIMGNCKQKPADRMLDAINYLTTYEKLQDKENIEKYDNMNLHDGILELNNFLDGKLQIAINGMGSAVYSSLKIDGNPLFAHTMVKRNFKSLDDEEVAEIVKAFVEIKNKASDKPIDEDPAVVNGFLSTDRNFYLRLITMTPNAEFEEDDSQFKKVLQPFKAEYLPEIGKKYGKEKLNFNLLNKALTIANLYLDSDAQLKPFEEKELIA